ncbi:unnamed protein product [Cuscuta campestris]|uniref:Uncharacterized protein n=1 Tax=Cuscuta campestris TaxID=132261 RepID=A0A484K277_9ASTE|nr:unnamed protein product [Cuscuta campestris]
MLTALRRNCSGLSNKAIVASDLLYDLVGGGEVVFTVLAPTVASLFELEMVKFGSASRRRRSLRNLAVDFESEAKLRRLAHQSQHLLQLLASPYENSRQ